MSDEIRLRQRLGSAHMAHNFAHIVDATLDELRKEMDLGRGKGVHCSHTAYTEKEKLVKNEEICLPSKYYHHPVKSLPYNQKDCEYFF
jgi:hypothetical protein